MTDLPNIRRATPDDARALAALKLATFRETFVEGFGIVYPPADKAVFEEETYGEARVLAELTDPDHATWVAEGAAGVLAAYAHVGPCKLPHPDVLPDAGELYQLYMLQRWQGGGLGRALMDIALEWLAVEKPGPVWLGVWSGNERAQRFYTRYGFAQVGTYDFAVGDHRDHEFILRRG